MSSTPRSLTAFPHHPAYELSGAPQFSDCYRLAHYVVSPIHGHSPPTVLLDRGIPRKCAICGDTENETTFQKIAHTLPAALGNRHHKTKEECDQCNSFYGTEYEQHLALWLAPERTMHRVRSREAPPQLSGPDGTSLKVDGVTGALVFNFNPEQIADLNRPQKNEFEIPYIRPACNRVSALRSLIKTAWLLLTPEERDRHKLLLSLIRKEVRLPIWEHWTMILPGNGVPLVQFEVWEKKTEINTAVAPLIIRLIIGNTVLLWVEPDSQTGQQLPSPLPPLEFQASPDDAKSVSATLSEITKDESSASRLEKVTFRYGSLSKVDSPLPGRAPPKHPQVTLKVQLCIDGHPDKTLRSTCYIRAYIDKSFRLYISGEEFAGALRIETISDKSAATAKLTTALNGSTPQVALKTLNFLRAIRDGNVGVSIVGEDGNSLFMLQEFAGKGLIPVPELDTLLKDIITVNEKFDLDLKYRDDISNEDLRDLYIVASAIRQRGIVEEPFSGVLTIRGKKNGSLKLIDAIESTGPSKFEVEQPVVYSFWGTELPPVKRTIILPKATLNVPGNELRREFETLAEDAIVAIPLTGDRIVYQFEQWM